MLSFRKINSNNRELMEVQSAVENAMRPLLKNPLSDGVLLAGVVLGTTGVKVPHKLGRKPQGYLVVDANAAATIYRTAWDTYTLTLVASAAVTVSLWVF